MKNTQFKRSTRCRHIGKSAMMRQTSPSRRRTCQVPLSTQHRSNRPPSNTHPSLQPTCDSPSSQTFHAFPLLFLLLLLSSSNRHPQHLHPDRKINSVQSPTHLPETTCSFPRIPVDTFNKVGQSQFCTILDWILPWLHQFIYPGLPRWGKACFDARRDHIVWCGDFGQGIELEEDFPALTTARVLGFGIFQVVDS
jgi:hypothetical protein